MTGEERRPGASPATPPAATGSAPIATAASTPEEDSPASRDRTADRTRSPWSQWYAVWNRLPWWAAVLILYGLSRVWGWLAFSVVGRSQGPGPWGDGPLGYLDFVNTWDSDWYRRIFESGYPVQIPRDAFGAAQENQWAFYPLHPLAVRALDALTGTGWAATSATLSLLAGFGTALVLYRLVTGMAGMARPVTAGGASVPGLWTVAVFAFNPVAPVLQTPYAESLHLFLLTSAVLAVVRRRAVPAALLTVLMSLTRPTGVAFAAALGVWWLWRSVVRVRRDRVPWWHCLDRWLLVALLGCVAALSWPVIAWYATGELTAYTDTEAAWRGARAVVPVLPWFEQATHYLGEVGGAVAPVLLVIGVVVMLRSRVTRRSLPFFARMWVAAYGAYLLVVLHPQSSTFRLLLPWAVLAAPLVHVSDSKAYRWLLVLTGMILQVVWIGWLWHWKQLPGGGDYPP